MPAEPSLPVAVAKKIDAACDRFEADWNAGRKPHIEDHLGTLAGRERDELLRALLALELELLARQGRAPDADAYRARFSKQCRVVESVLSSAADRTGPYAPSSAAKQEPPLPKTIGRFEIIERLGRGAFGQVFRARDPRLDREVAIKVPLKGVLVTEQDVARFLREARAAAGLQHPNICPVHEIDAHGKYPLIVMALIQGQTLSAMIRDRKGPISVKQAAQIVRKLAQALEGAHAKGIIHRDLKSANVMFDRERKDVVIMDFGLARRTASGDASQTKEGTLIGSPAYMSPEQARGDVKAVGPLSDQYSLGVILYELLTGRLPFLGTVNEVLGKVQFVEPEAPSKLRPGLDPALEGICLQALAKDPTRRFGSMRDLADALGAWLKDAPATAAAPAAPSSPAGPAVDTVEALGAKMDTLAQEQKRHTTKAVAKGMKQSARGTRRMLLFVGTPVAVLLLIVTGVVIFLAWQGPGYVDQRVTVNLFNIPYLDDAGVVFVLDGNTVSAKKLSAPIQLTVGPHELVIKRGSDVLETRTFHIEAADADRTIAVPDPEPAGEAGMELFTLKHPTYVHDAAFTPDGKRILSASYGGPNLGFGTVRLWELGKDKPLKELELLSAARVAVSSDGRRAVFASVPQSTPPTLRTWSMEPWSDLTSFQFPLGPGGRPRMSMTSLALTADGKKVLAARQEDAEFLVGLFDADSGAVLFKIPGYAACFTADQRRILVANGNDVEEHDAADGKLLRNLKGHSEMVTAVACSAGGKRAVSASSGTGNSLRVWDLETGEVIKTLAGHEGGVPSLDISRDGRLVLSGSDDKTVRLWDVEKGKERSAFRGHEAAVRTVAFSPGGRRALSASFDGTVRVWQLP